MSQTWNLTDTRQSTYIDSWQLDGAEHGWPGLRVDKKRLQGGLSDNVDLVTISDGRFTWHVIPTRGMSLWNAQLNDWQAGWDSPIEGPVHPCFVPVDEPGGLGWLRGFDEMLVRCGLESNGAPEFDDDGRLAYPLHGRIGNLPAQRVAVTLDADAGELTIEGSVLESRFHFSKLRLDTRMTMKRGESAIHIVDTITNVSASPGEAQMLYHTNLGAPVMDGGAQFVAPIKKVMPRNEHAASSIDQWQQYSAPQAGIEEQVYFATLHADDRQKTLSMLKNAHGTHAVCLRHNVEQLPVFSLWKNPTAVEDGYVTGLEPGTNFPNPRSFEGEHDRFIALDPGQSVDLELSIELLSSGDLIADREKEIEQLQALGEPEVFTEPQADWCAP